MDRQQVNFPSRSRLYLFCPHENLVGLVSEHARSVVADDHPHSWPEHRNTPKGADLCTIRVAGNYRAFTSGSNFDQPSARRRCEKPDQQSAENSLFHTRARTVLPLARSDKLARRRIDHGGGFKHQFAEHIRFPSLHFLPTTSTRRIGITQVIVWSLETMASHMLPWSPRCWNPDFHFIGNRNSRQMDTYDGNPTYDIRVQDSSSNLASLSTQDPSYFVGAMVSRNAGPRRGLSSAAGSK